MRLRQNPAQEVEGQRAPGGGGTGGHRATGGRAALRAPQRHHRAFRRRWSAPPSRSGSRPTPDGSSRQAQCFERRKISWSWGGGAKWVQHLPAIKQNAYKINPQRRHDLYGSQVLTCTTRGWDNVVSTTSSVALRLSAAPLTSRAPGITWLGITQRAHHVHWKRDKNATNSASQ